MPDVTNISFTNIIGSLIFGTIGLAVFIYGRKQQEIKPLLIGVLLIGYPYFIASTLLLYGIGVGLCVLLYFWRD